MNPLESPFERMKPLIHCPVCQKKYDPGRVTLLAEDGRKTALHLSCDGCGAASIVFVSVGKAGAVSLGLLTDLEADEAKRFYGREAVTPDDALTLHRFFRDFRGGAERCLPKRTR
jgi:hypothetical protein